jgi:hypothetical protein
VPVHKGAEKPAHRQREIDLYQRSSGEDGGIHPQIILFKKYITTLSFYFYSPKQLYGRKKQFAPVNPRQSFSIKQSIATTIPAEITLIFTCYAFMTIP